MDNFLSTTNVFLNYISFVSEMFVFCRNVNLALYILGHRIKMYLVTQVAGLFPLAILAPHILYTAHQYQLK